MKTRRSSESLREDFEPRYVAHADPWHFADSAYECAKYVKTLGYLTRPRYEAVLEPGCSIGVLTERLAPYATHLLALDISPSAAERARRRCESLRNVHVQAGDFREVLDDQAFDLIVLSEIGYYFDAAELAELARALAASLKEKGEIIGVHWLGESADHALGGDEVHAILGAEPRLHWERGECAEIYRIDRWSRA